MSGEWLAKMKDIVRADERRRTMHGRRITFHQAQKQNWPAYTCKACYSPCRYDRDGLCASCLRDLDGAMYETVKTKPKQLLPIKENPCQPK